jgi:hypothetical protein
MRNSSTLLRSYHFSKRSKCDKGLKMIRILTFPFLIFLSIFPLQASAQMSILPSAQAPSTTGATRPSGGESQNRLPVSLKVPSPDDLTGRDLKLNGRDGLIRIERTGKDQYGARVRLAGTRLSKPDELCSVEIGDGDFIPLTSEGRPEGAHRYALKAAICPIRMDVLQESVFISRTEGEKICRITQADCKVEPVGLWGPEARGVTGKTKEIEKERGSADRYVREAYRRLTQNAGPEARLLITEQAAFSSEREMLCRSYDREDSHGFCHARISQGRAIMLGQKLNPLQKSR